MNSLLVWFDYMYIHTYIYVYMYIYIDSSVLVGQIMKYNIYND